jgi:hypothetical protein
MVMNGTSVMSVSAAGSRFAASSASRTTSAGKSMRTPSSARLR